MSSLPAELFRASGDFARSPLFAIQPMAPPVQDERPKVDAEAQAYALGFAEGSAQATETALAAERERDLQRGAIELAFARFDDQSAALVGERLRQTVMALCEGAVLPLALDAEGLAARIGKAVSMLQRAQDDRRVFLHPDDLELVGHRLPEGIVAEPDPAVERGGLRIETPEGGIEDGPSQWRRILAEAFREC